MHDPILLLNLVPPLHDYQEWLLLELRIRKA